MGVSVAWSRKVNGDAPLGGAPSRPQKLPPALSIGLPLLLGKLSLKHPEVCILSLVKFIMKLSYHHA